MRVQEKDVEKEKKIRLSISPKKVFVSVHEIIATATPRHLHLSLIEQAIEVNHKHCSKANELIILLLNTATNLPDSSNLHS